MCTCSCTVGKKQVSFTMTIGNEEHARVFSQPLAHGKSKNEIRQRKKRRKEEMREHGKKQSGHEKMKSQRPKL